MSPQLLASVPCIIVAFPCVCLYSMDACSALSIVLIRQYLIPRDGNGETCTYLLIQCL